MNNPAFADLIHFGDMPDAEFIETDTETGELVTIHKKRRAMIAPMPERRADAQGLPAVRLFLFNDDELVWTQRFVNKEAARAFVQAEIDADRHSKKRYEESYQFRKALERQQAELNEQLKRQHAQAALAAKSLEKNQLKLNLEVAHNA